MEILGLLFLLIVIVLLWPTGPSIFRRKKMSKEDADFMQALRDHKHVGVEIPYPKNNVYTTTPDDQHAPVRKRPTRFPGDLEFSPNESLTHRIATGDLLSGHRGSLVDHCHGSSSSSDHGGGGSGGSSGKGSDD